MLKHKVIAADAWHDNVPQEVISVSLYIKIAINKMLFCSLSIVYSCPFHNPTIITPPPWGTQFTTFTSANQ
jgi:hypothetical protein